VGRQGRKESASIYSKIAASDFKFSIDLDLAVINLLPNWKSLSLHVTKMGKAMQNTENWMFLSSYRSQCLFILLVPILYRFQYSMIFVKNHRF